MKNKLGIVACSLFLAIGALCVAAVLPVPDLTVQAACSYIGNHYTEHNASDTEYGCREYWICCSCHTIFTDVTTGKPTTGTCKDSGRANIDFTDEDSADPRFIDKIKTKEMETILSNLGFKTVKQLSDGTMKMVFQLQDLIQTYNKSYSKLVAMNGFFISYLNFWKFLLQHYLHS